MQPYKRHKSGTCLLLMKKKYHIDYSFCFECFISLKVSNEEKHDSLRKLKLSVSLYHNDMFKMSV